MTTKPQHQGVKAFNNPFDGSFDVRLFCLLVIAGTLTAIVICSSLITYSADAKLVILQTYIVIIAAGWFTFSSCNSQKDFFFEYFMMLGITLSVFFMVTTLSAILFWLCLGVITVLGASSAYDKSKDDLKIKGSWKVFIIPVYSAWVISGIFITLGSTSVLPYAQSAISLSDIHLFLNIRFLLTALVVTSLIGKAMADTVDGPEIKISPLQGFSISEAEDEDSLFGAIFRALTVVANVILAVIQKITNAVWHVIALVGVFLYRTGKNLANNVVDIITSRGLWFGIFRVVGTFILLVLFAIIISDSSQRLYIYLTSDTSPFMISGANLVTLITTGLIFLCTLILIIVQCLLWEIDKKPLVRTAFGGAMLLVACAISGFIVYLLTRTGWFGIDGFDSIGMFTVLLLIAVGVVFLYQIGKRATATKSQPIK